MNALESLLIDLLLRIVPRADLNAALGDPRTVAILIGALIAVSGALLGTFLLLRGMALTSDAISHTVLLGIVVAFLVMTGVFGQEPDLSSPWLILGAAGAGVATVVLTELIYRSGLVKQDAALGLAFPLLFALAVILVSRFAEDIHLDEDSVMVGEIGLAWADANSHCLSGCETVTITPGDPRAVMSRQCSNCRELGISPRDPGAAFSPICVNCGTYTPAQAWQAGLIAHEPQLIFWPRALTVMTVLTLLTTGFVVLFYKELKLAAFDPGLARALGLRPGLLHYLLMVLVSLVAVGAFSAVGSILVIAFFIIPPATAYLLTNRLWVMLTLSALIGGAGAYFGYDLARGSLFGLFPLADGIAFLNRTFGLNWIERWNSSISASIVLMLFLFFVAAWVCSPQYGLIAAVVRRIDQRRRFDNQVVLGHIHHHQHTASAAQELNRETLHEHFHWSRLRMARVLARLLASRAIRFSDGQIELTRRGAERLSHFHEHDLGSEP